MAAIAIDGPSGVGKSTLARAAAREMGYLYIDTGAFYRAVTLYFLRHDADLDNASQVRELLGQVSLNIAYQDGEQRIFLNGEDVSEAIRTPEVTRNVSAVSALGEVRANLVRQQQELARQSDVVMDGRDIGTVVLPDARFKFFLTATDAVRAERRYREYLAKGQKVAYNDVLEDMRRRDHADSTREITPLRAAEDAILLDTSDLTFDQVLKQLITIVKGN